MPSWGCSVGSKGEGVQKPVHMAALISFTAAALAVAALSGLTACAPARTLDPSIQQVHIPMFQNRTYEYGAEERVTDRIIQEFLLDGRLEPKSLSAADAILDATIIQYDINTLVRDDRGETIGSNVTIELIVAFTDRGGEPIVPTRSFQRSGTFFFETQPGLARESDVISALGEDILSYIIEDW